MTDLSPPLQALGEELERSVRSAPSASPRRRPLSRRAALVAAAAALVVPGAAVAASAIFSTQDVAQSLPAGTKALIGTHPVCTVVTAGIEYSCTLAAPPSLGVEDATDTAEPTVDATKHVNGGCRAQDATGAQWLCYIGEAAVTHGIISEGFLGQYAPAPGVG
jgi:hypothetical protein